MIDLIIKNAKIATASDVFSCDIGIDKEKIVFLEKNSSKEAKAVKLLLKKKKINLIILKNVKKINKNIQHQARDVRYNLLLNFCNKNKIILIW